MTTRSSHITLMTALASFAALTANAAHAGDQEMLDTCIQHFIASDFADFGGKISVRKELTHSLGFAGIAPHTNTVKISAADSHGALLVSATCKLDTHGNVLSMTSVKTTASKLSQTKPVRVAIEE